MEIKMKVILFCLLQKSSEKRENLKEIERYQKKYDFSWDYGKSNAFFTHLEGVFERMDNIKKT